MVDKQESNKTAEEVAEDEPYDPYLHREVSKPVSNFGTFANLVKSAAGTGLFAMPHAFACVGLLNGIVGTILMGLLVTGSLQILVRIHYLMCVRLRKPTLTYDEVVIATLTTGTEKPWVSLKMATCIVDTTILTCYIGVGAVYTVFISGTIQECIDTERTTGQRYYILILFPFLLLMNLIRNLHDLTPMSIIGNIILFLAGTIGVVYALKDGIGDTWVTVSPDISLYPKFFGVVFFSIASPGVILAMEHSMKSPWNYTKLCGILNWGMAFLVLVHVFVGAMGYLKWGSDSLGNFIRNHRENDGPTIAALLMQALAIYFTYGLQCYMPITILKNEYIIPALNKNICKGTPFLWDLIIRFAITFVTCILGMAIPKLDLFTGLVGAICISTLAIIIPIMLYILVHSDDFGKLKWRLVFGVSMLTVGFFITICAVVVNTILLFKYFSYGYVLHKTVEKKT